MPDELAVCDLVKRYPGTAGLDGVSFTVGAGEIFGLLGKNGAGKTTAIECIIGLRSPDSGTIHIAGVDAIAHRAQGRQQIGVQLQSTALHDKITPREAISLFASFYRAPADPRSLIHQFDLTEKADAAFDTLSGGQRQRLALALAFVNQPRILFLDEPTAGLDAQSRRQLQQLIASTQKQGRTVVLTTHDIDEAQSLCDRVAIIDRGKIVASGTPQQLIDSSRGFSHIDIHTSSPVDLSLGASIPGVTHAIPRGDGWRLSTESPAQTVSALVAKLQADGNELLDLRVQKPTLEDLFIDLTGGLPGEEPASD
jgi:ABC-2 type transport system ATP-binding protein